MNIIKNVTLILLMLLSTTNIYADSTKLFDDNATTNQSSRDMVGDDGMVEENIDIGVRYRVNMGEKTDTVTEDESGNISITDANGTTTTGKLSEFNHEPYRTEEFEDLKKASINYFLENAANTDKRIDLNSTDEEVRENWDKLQHQNEEKSQLQIKQNKFIKDNGSSLLNNKEVFLNKRSPFRGGNSAIDSFTNNISKITDEKFMGQEDNATKYYKEKVGVTPGYNPKQELMQRNIGALSNAYSNIDDITKKLTEKLNGSKISCQITRDLIPSFYCPLTGKQGLRFPGTDVNGLHEVNQDEELKKCNDYCMTDITEVNGTDGTFDHLEGEIPCVSEQVMPSSDLNISEDIDLEIYPTYSSTATQRAITTNGIIPIDTITITIEIPNPNQKGNTPEDQKYLDNEWKKFLRNNPLTMRINLAIDKKWNKSDNIRDDEDTVTHKSYIAQNRTVLINSPKVEFSFSYNGELSDKYYIELKKPYFRFLTAQNKFINSGAKVTIKNLTARYMSDSYYYCTGTQFVGNPLDCKGNTRAITVAGTPQYLCSDQAHKRGPVATEYGGFYNNDSCVRACVRRRECLSTYTHYSNQVESDGSPSVAMLQSSIDCVESPTEINGACTKQICENFFKDDIFPINEILVAKDNTNIYTVKDGALTDHPRPKVDYEREINAPNLTLAWQEEEKDAAYRQMIRDLTYNRIKYRIGEVSPANVAVKEEPITINQTKIIGYLKPKSNDFTKTGYIYAVLRLEHWYRPVAGVYMIDGKIISVGDNTDVRFKDVTYAIKLMCIAYVAQPVGHWGLPALYSKTSMMRTRHAQSRRKALSSPARGRTVSRHRNGLGRSHAF